MTSPMTPHGGRHRFTAEWFAISLRLGPSVPVLACSSAAPRGQCHGWRPLRRVARGGDTTAWRGVQAGLDSRCKHSIRTVAIRNERVVFHPVLSALKWPNRLAVRPESPPKGSPRPALPSRGEGCRAPVPSNPDLNRLRAQHAAPVRSEDLFAGALRLARLALFITRAGVVEVFGSSPHHGRRDTCESSDLELSCHAQGSWETRSRRASGTSRRRSPQGRIKA